ncbi:MAG: hypothetical protein CSA33_08140 [Desulfobulbus propionicus]|nr:MAG: hypothetical protein CSA33_08140 [Desulfobulbus propionicus]
MQVLKDIYHRVAVCLFAAIMTAGVLVVSPGGDCQADAIGKWVDGIVTRKPWKGKRTYIMVDETRYTIMDDVILRRVYEEDAAVYKEYITLKDLHQGSRVLMMAEGNRVYQIEQY